MPGGRLVAASEIDPADPLEPPFHTLVASFFNRSGRVNVREPEMKPRTPARARSLFPEEGL